MKRLTSRLTFANVMSAIAVFLSLTTSSAFAVTMLTGANIKDSSLTGIDIRDGSLSGRDIGNGKLNGADIADGGLNGADIATNGIGSGDIADGAVNGADIADGSVVGGDLANGSVTSSDIADDSIGLTDLTTATRDALSITMVKQVVPTVPSDLTSRSFQTPVTTVDCPGDSRAVGGGSFSQPWIDLAAVPPNETTIAQFGSKPSISVPAVDASGNPTGWTLQAFVWAQSYGLWMSTEDGPQPTGPFGANEYHPITLYALCAA